MSSSSSLPSSSIPSSISSSHSSPINIVGAGLAGSMAALLLAQQAPNTPIRLLEARPDFRRSDSLVSTSLLSSSNSSHLGQLTNSLKRSINLALSHRGICALKAAGIFEKVQEHLIPMRGRIMHGIDSSHTFQPYGVGDQAIYSVSRAGLNKLLLDELDKLDNVECIFNTKVTGIDQEGNVKSGSNTFEAQFSIGADGAYSAVRESMRRFMRMDFSMEYIKCGYKELSLPPNRNGGYAFDDWQGLHIWPRHDFMLIALPNPDFTFTCTLFAPFEGPEGLDNVKNDEQILAYFNKYYPDFISLCPDLTTQWKESLTSALLTVRCSPWNYKDKVVLLGDAAHAVVPFYGQGMNSAFEDCLHFSELFSQFSSHPSLLLSTFNEQRCPAGQALADLSLENFIEMRDKTASSSFLLQKKIESVLHHFLPNYWIPQYTMVAFTRIPYHQAKKRAERQNEILRRTALALKIAGVGVIGLLIYAGYSYLGQPYPKGISIKQKFGRL